jgi:hypothetical protein
MRLIFSIPLKVEINLRSAQHYILKFLRISDSIEFIDENGGGPWVTAKKATPAEGVSRMMPIYKTNPI